MSVENLKKTWLVVIFLVAGFGCATQPRQPALVPVSPAKIATALEARTLDSASLKAFIEQNRKAPLPFWPLKQWDLHLLMLAAFYYHSDLDLARARWGVAEAGMITAGARPNPSFGAGAQYNTNAVGEAQPWTVGINLDIPIETANKRGYRIEQAKHASASARFNVAQTAWQVRSRVRATLLDLSAARQAETLLQRQEQVQATIFELLEQRLKFGMASQPEVTQASIALGQARLELQESRKRAAEATARLAAAIGVPGAALENVDVTVRGFEQDPKSTTATLLEARRRALTGRPDILAALADYRASQAALHLEIAKQMPDIHLGPGFTWDAGALKWLLGFNITLPILNKNEGPIAEAEAKRKLAAVTVEALQARVIGDIDQALASYRSALKKLATADTLIGAQKKRQDAIARQFKAGEADKLQLTSTRLELVSIELLRENTRISTLQALGALEDALGQPLEEAMASPKIPERNPRDEVSRK